MEILGISEEHDIETAFIADGKILYASNEEGI